MAIAAAVESVVAGGERGDVSVERKLRKVLRPQMLTVSRGEERGGGGGGGGYLETPCLASTTFLPAAHGGHCTTKPDLL
jgi:hypothetical protein